ncbi:MAG: cobalamin-dependent protein [Candidatus Adiutrix sp.]|jgi:radical SAM superfamily enzyme YgiQ (UPF0313 family)|nr:cobalamin-dependent protein [Candidatus Adiutrix sp.]
MFLEPEKLYGLRGQTILGINPPVLDFAWFDLWAKPLGLLNVLGFLRSRGNRVHLLDCMYEGRVKPIGSGRWKVAQERREKPAPLRDIPRHFHRFGLSPVAVDERLDQLPAPDVILVTSIMTYWYAGVFETIAQLKRRYPKTPVILGGIYALLCPEHAAHSGADFIVAGSGPELPFTPLPLDLYEEPQYAVLSASRGCPRRCDYCASALIAPRFQPKPLPDIFADLARQTAAGPVTDVAFYDDALLWGKEKRFQPLCEHLREKYPHLRLHTPNGLSVNELDRPTAEILRQTGFATLRLSLEGVGKTADAAGAHKTSQDNYLRAVENLLAVGYQPDDLETYLLAGLPGQSLEEVEQSIAFVKSAGARPKLGEFSPIPGTKLFQAAAEAHPIILTEPLWHNNTAYAPYLSRHFPPETWRQLKASLL